MNSTEPDPLAARALRRDKRFLWRLIAGLIVATGLGLFLFGKLTGDEVAGCASQSFRSLTAQ